jgi:hypothetical protein
VFYCKLIRRGPTENRTIHRRMNISRSRTPKPDDGCGSRERGLLAEIRVTQIEYKRESRLGDATEIKSGRRLILTLTLELIAPTQPDTRTEDQRKNHAKERIPGGDGCWSRARLDEHGTKAAVLRERPTLTHGIENPNKHGAPAGENEREPRRRAVGEGRRDEP